MKHTLLVTLALSLSLLTEGPSSAQYHTNPSCWPEPRIHAEDREATFAVSLERVDGQRPEGLLLSPNGAYGVAVKRPDRAIDNPRPVEILIDNERSYTLRLELPPTEAVETPQWINEKLLFVRVWWGRVAGTDYLIDVESETFVRAEPFRYGAIAFQQYQESCATPQWRDTESCRCYPGQPSDWRPRQRPESQLNARPRIRELGVFPGILPPGPNNAITDVVGVRVGHATLVEGDSIRTGVTAIVPAPGNVFQKKVPAAVYAANAFGKAAGFLQVKELGNLETPIVLTNTLSVGVAVDAVVGWTLSQPGNEAVRSVNAVVGETNDGWLNDIRGRHVRAEHVVAAIEAAQSGPVAEGSVGAGTGTRAFGFKGGIGTSSRQLPQSLGGYTIGALVQSNFGGILTIDGHRVGEALGSYAFEREIEEHRSQKTPPEEGSAMIVIATDAPLEPRNLERMARRAVLGLARTGSFMSNGSGDFVIVFSTANRKPYAPKVRSRTVDELYNDAMGPLFLATVEAVEEAVYNSLLRATTTTGVDGHVVEALSIDRLRQLLR